MKVLFLLGSLALALFYRFWPERVSPGGTPCGGQAGCFTGVVAEVIDGDTLQVGDQRIRLVLVDAPEWNERGGSASTEYLRALCPVGSAAVIDQDDRQPTDPYGRMLAVVWCGGRRANEELIRSGRAEVYRRFCAASEFGDDPWAVALGCH